jgi:hypothetical protein
MNAPDQGQAFPSNSGNSTRPVVGTRDTVKDDQLELDHDHVGGISSCSQANLLHDILG